MNQKKICALVLGGKLNGYSTINELHENSIENIVLFEAKKVLPALAIK